MKCLICRNAATHGDLCGNCFAGLERFKRDKRLLGRSISYLMKKSKLETKHDRRIKRRRRSDLEKLIAEQKADYTK